MTLHATTTTRKSRYSRGPEALDKADALIKEKMQRDPRSRLEYLAHELLHEISEQLYALRKEAGLTQQELADKIDVPQSFIARLESPYTTNKHPSLPTLAKVAAALGRKLVVRFEKTSEQSIPFSKGGKETYERAKSPEIQDHYKDEDIVEYDLAAAEEEGGHSGVESNVLGSLIIEGASYNVSEDDKGYVCLHGVIPPNVTHLHLGNTLYELKCTEGEANLCTVLIGMVDMGNFLDKHNINHEDHPARFEYRK
jgi:transcriptional regulator with XRE-family HTH domain